MQGNLKHPTSGNSVCRDAYQPDLALFGERALAINSYSKPTKVVSFKDGAVYTPYVRSPSPRINTSHSNYSAFVKGYNFPTEDKNAGQGSYIIPPNSPTDAERKNVERPNSRRSVTPQRPLSGHGRMGLRKGRPTSGHSELESRCRAESSVSEYADPDHEPITEVLSRLGDYTHTFKPEISLINTDCECRSHEERVLSRLAKVYDSDNGDSTDSDDEGVTIDMMLKTFKQYEDKGHSSVRKKAMLTLLEGFTGEELLTYKNAEQLMYYLHGSLVEVQEASLLLLKLCAKKSENVRLLLDLNILDMLFSCLQSVELAALARPVLLLLAVIFTHSQFRDNWFNLAYTKITPELLKILRGQSFLEVKYAACCVFRALAQYDEFIVHVTDVILPIIIMLRNSSAKFKEIYVDILTAVLASTDQVPPDLVDNSAIPITASIIREGPCGPQCAAIELLSSLTTNDTGVAMVIGTNGMVPMVLCCMRESHCRKVRLCSTELIKQLSTSRKLGLCKDLMIQFSCYLIPDLDKESLTSLSFMADPQKIPMATKPRFDEERRMWQGLEKFIDMTKDIIYREAIIRLDITFTGSAKTYQSVHDKTFAQSSQSPHSSHVATIGYDIWEEIYAKSFVVADGCSAKVETNELDTVIKIHMKPGIDVCPTQLTVLSYSLHILQSMCLWPLDKSRLGFSANKIDLTTFTDDEKQMMRLSKVNRGLTQAIWDKVGQVVTDLLSSYASRFKDFSAQKCHEGRQVSLLDDMFEPQEVRLIISMLELLLCTAICTCTGFPEILPSKVNKSSNKQSSSTKLKSSSSPQMYCDTDKEAIDSRLKSQSEIGNRLNADGEKYWVSENPHLTSIHGYSSHSSTAVDKSKAELKLKEACTERRLLRKCLFEAGVFECVCPFLMCSDSGVQVLVLQILRCLIQPLEERVAPLPPKLSFTASGSSSSKPRQRPKSAMCAHEAQRKVNIALYKMSPDLAGLIKEALGARSDTSEEESGNHPSLEIPGQPGGLETIQERLQEYTENLTESPASPEQPHVPKFSKPVIDRCRPIAQQCRELLLLEVGDRVVREIFNKSKSMKKQCVLLLHDLVQHGEVSTHMKLSEHGCMPKLVDYLRVNEDDEILEIIGLIIVRLLVKSDNRLKQLFSRHGGPPLLIAMAQYTKGLLKQEVSTTLKTVTKVDTAPTRKRPVSAPVVRSHKPPDIWDHIQTRWKQEDQVQVVLRQWIQ